MRRGAVALVLVAVVGGAGAAVWSEPAGANVSGISVSVSSGGSCSDAATPTGFDDAFDCTMTQGGSLVVVGSADSNQNSLRLWWSSAGGVSDRESQGALMVDVLPDFSTRYWRENTATLSCTRDGTATLTARDSSDTDKIRLSIDCEPLPVVSVSGLGGASREGPGEMTDRFTVSPSGASCSFARVSGVSMTMAWTDSTSASRALRATAVGTGESVVSVTCSAAGHTAVTSVVTFTARRVPVSVTSLSGRVGTVGSTLSDPITVSPSGASCDADSTGSASAWVSGSGGRPRVEVTSSVVETVTVTVTCTLAHYDDGTASAVFGFEPLPVVSVSGLGGASREGPGEMTDRFTVSPSGASCSFARVSGVSMTMAWTDSTSASRALRATAVGTGESVVSVTCSAAGHTAVTSVVTFTARRVPVRIAGLTGRSGPANRSLTDAVTVTPSGAGCSGSSDGSASVSVTGSGSSRSVVVSPSGVETVTVTVTCTLAHYDDGTASAVFGFEPLGTVGITGLDDVEHDRVDGAELTLSEEFSVWPSDVSCTAAFVSGMSASPGWADGFGRDRVLTVTTTELSGTARIKVACSKANYASASATASFEVNAPRVSVTGWDDGSGTAGGEPQDRAEEAFTVKPSTASCTLARTAGLPASAVSAVFADDVADSVRLVYVSATRAGTVTVKVSCSQRGWVPWSSSADFEFAAKPVVAITGLGGGSRDGPGEVDASFAVSPATAQCTAAAPADSRATATDPLGAGGRRSFTVSMPEPATVTVTVTCTESRYGAGTASAAFTARRVPVSVTGLSGASGPVNRPLGATVTVSPQTAACSGSATGSASASVTGTGSSRSVAVRSSAQGAATVTVTCTLEHYDDGAASALFTFEAPAVQMGLRADAGGGCGSSATVEEGFDAQFGCWMGIGRSLTLEAAAQGPQRGLAVTWSVAAGLTLGSQAQGDPDQIVGPDGTVVFKRTATAVLGCTSDGAATVATSVGGVAAHRTKVTVNCRPLVRVTGVVGAADTARVLTDGFTVTPAAAQCTAKRVGGVRTEAVTVTGSGAARSVNVTVPDSVAGFVTVEVTCSAHPTHAPTTVSAEFVRIGECTDDLGSLGVGTRVRRGALAATGGCVSWKRGGAASPHWARRFSLRVPEASTVTIDAESGAVDVFLYVLRGSGTAAAILSSDDDSGAGSDARISDQRLETGLTYVVEVTSKTARATGAFTVTVTTADAVPEIGDVAVTVPGGGCTAVSGPDAAGVDAAYRCAMDHDETLTATATATADGSAIAMSWAATGGITAAAAAPGSATPLLNPDNTPTGDWQRTAAATLGCTAAGTATLTVTLTQPPGAAEPTDTHTARLIVACRPPVGIDTLDASGATGAADTAVTVSDTIDVTPADAVCSATPAAASVTPASGIRRTVAVAVTVPGAVTVTVECTHPDRAAATAQALFTAAQTPQLGDVTVTVPAACTADADAAAGADLARSCTLEEGDTLAISVTAAATADGPTFSWTAAAGVSVDAPPAPPAAQIVAPDGSAATWTRTAAATLRCTADGSAALSIAHSHPDAAEVRTVHVAVDCAAPAAVRVEGLAAASAAGYRTAAVASAFTVAPAAAGCTATPAAATITPTTGARRTVALDVAVGATATVTLTCTHAPLPAATATAVFAATAADACSDHIGTLAAGLTRRTGSVAAGTACTSAKRRPPGDARVHYARRHTFTLDRPAGIDIYLDGRTGLDAYVIVTRGHTPGTGPEEGRDDDGGRGVDSRLEFESLPAGDYTVEITSYGPNDTGTYLLDITASYPPPGAAPAISSAVLAAHRCETSTAGTLPDGIHSADACTLARGDTVAAALTAVADHPAIAVEWAAAPGTAITAARTPTAAPVIGPDGAATGDWTLTATAAIACTANSTPTVTVTAGAAPTTAVHTKQLDIDCQTPVQITGLDDTTAPAGTVTDAFTVTPPTARCTATATAAVTPAVTPAAGTHRTLAVALAAGATATVTVVCAADGYADGTAQAELTAAVWTLSVSGGRSCVELAAAPAGADPGWSCVLSNEHRLTVVAAVHAAGRDIAIGWTAASGTVVERRRLDAAAPVAAPNGELSGIWRRVGAATLSCTADGTVTLSASVGSGDGAVTRTVAIAVDCEDQGALGGLDDVTASGTGTVRVSDTFAVAPATAECTATATAAAPAVSAAGGGSRTVALSLAAAAGEAVTSTVSVDCTPPGHAPVTASATFTVTYADSCDDPLGTLRDGVTARTGAIAADSGCTSPQRHRNGGSDATRYARRHTFELTSPGSVRVELSDSASDAERLDTYLLVLAGHNQDGTGTVLGRNDDGIGTSDSRRFFPRLEPGRYTIEATTYAARATGAYDLRVTAQLEVTIDGLHGSTRVGTGPASDHFTVLPADATCTTSTGAVTADGDGDGERTLTVNLAALGDTEATVACARTDYEPATATVTLTAAEPTAAVTVRATGGGRCSAPAASGGAYRCTMARGGTLRVAADASANTAELTAAWTTPSSDGVAIGAQDPGTLIPSIGPDGSLTWHRVATAAVGCTADGTLTAAATAGAAPDRVARSATVEVDCQTPVAISGLADTTRSGSGTVTVAGTFTVTPATAACTATATAGTPTVTADSTVPAERSVAVALAAPGTAQVTVRCTAAGYAPGTEDVTLTAAFAEACLGDLGRLGNGVTTGSGTIAADAACTSAQRNAVGSGVFYARRHAFSVARAANVTVTVADAAGNDPALDPYGLLISGRSNDGAGAVVGRDDNTGTGTAAAVTATGLAAGDYTVEATTAAAGMTGGYGLSVDVRLEVAITGLDGVAQSRPAGQKATLSGTFTVAPAAAACTTAAGTVTAGAQGERTLSVTMDGNTTQQVTVTCTRAGHPDGIRTVTFSTTGSCTALNARAAKHSASPEARNAIARGTCSEPEPDRCASTLALPAIGPAPPIAGTIAADSNCVSTQRHGTGAAPAQPPGLLSLAELRYWSHRHRFTLTADAWTAFDVISAGAGHDAVNPYVVLTSGHTPAGEVIERDLNRAAGEAAISGQYLQAGDYTLEVTTEGAYDAGTYTLTAEITATGLARTHTGIVGTATELRFKYWPADAQVAIRAAANEELEPAIATARATTSGISHGTATITLTPRLAYTHQDTDDPHDTDTGITVRVQTATSTRLLGGIALTVGCPTGKTPSVNNDVLCISTSVTQRDEAGTYRVTPGTLNGILASAKLAAKAAVVKYPTCGITTNKLAAFLLSIGYHEINHGRTDTAPSPQSLGRWDTYAYVFENPKLHNRYNYVNDAEGYEATGVWDEPRRAYFHPGVGWWQIDDQGYWPRLNHGQRADTGLGLDGRFNDQTVADPADSGGQAVAARLAEKYCGSPGLGSLKSDLNSTWHACKRYRPGMCYETYEAIYVGYGSDHDDLHVTIVDVNAGEYSTDGGVSAHLCRWHDATEEEDLFGCFLYDTENPEGRAEDSDKWGYHTSQSPLAAPFMAFNDGGKRFAVFPGPVMTALKLPRHGTTRVFDTWTKAVREAQNVRHMDHAGAGLWSSGRSDRHGTPGNAADDSVLEVEFCDAADWVLAGGAEPQCRWLSVDSSAFARWLGYGRWPVGVP